MAVTAREIYKFYIPGISRDPQKQLVFDWNALQPHHIPEQKLR
jgi:hypothetical protein